MKDYHLSRYSIHMPIEIQSEAFVTVYHTLTQAHAIFPAHQWDNILGEGSVVDTKTVEYLRCQGFIVPKGVDERIIFGQWRERHVHDFSSMRSKVLVTRQCNNRCTYCIIDPEARTMSSETARQMDNFYLQQIKHNRPLRVRDDYLGGEPLLNADVILASTTRRLNYCQKAGVEYEFSITTNGTLATPAVINKLMSAGMTTMRVSLAGPAAVHDTLRPMKGGSGSYAIILDNLEKISGSVSITIECQYDAASDDYLRIPQMLDDLHQRGIKVDEIAFTPILPKRGGRNFCGGMGDTDKYLYLTAKAVEKGFAAQSGPPSNACMADFRSIYVFDTDGALIPCPSLQSGEMVYGSAAEGIDFVAESQVLDRRLPERCLQQCELLPVCMGGCRLQALTHGRGFNGIDCHYERYRRLLEDYIYKNALDAIHADKAVAA